MTATVTREEMLEVRLSNGQLAVVDAEDFALVSQFKWHTKKGRYTAYARTQTDDAFILMHRLILGARQGQMIDHIDGDGLNNRRSNLRFCDFTLNNANCVGRSKYGVKGVVFDRRCIQRPWRAQIIFRGRRISSSAFATKEEAGAAYRELAASLHGAPIRFDMKSEASK